MLLPTMAGEEVKPVAGFQPAQRQIQVVVRTNTTIDHGGGPLRSIQPEVQIQIVGIIPIAGQASQIIITTQIHLLQTGAVLSGTAIPIVTVPLVLQGALALLEVVHGVIREVRVREAMEERGEGIDILA